MKTPRLLAVLLMAAALVACGEKSVVEVDGAKAEAERKAAAEHFGDSQYAKVEPLGAPKDDKKADQAKPDQPKPDDTQAN